jgi:hypothetical protein
VPLPRTQRHLLKLTQNNLLLDIDDEDDGPPGPDELDMQRGFGRPKLTKPFYVDDTVSDYVAIRLAVIRAKTLHKYREIYYNSET